MPFTKNEAYHIAQIKSKPDNSSRLQCHCLKFDVCTKKGGFWSIGASLFIDK